MSSIRRRERLIAVTATAGFVGLVGAAITLAGPASAVPGFSFDRLQGTDRFATAAAIARHSFSGATFALLANGQEDDPRTEVKEKEHFPDALAGSYLAGARSAPTLLTTLNDLPAATSAALEDIGVSTVIIIGGPAAVSTAQEQKLRDAGYSVQRFGGADRYETAAGVARTPGKDYVGSVDGRRTAVVASGTAFPDALVTGPLSYAERLPMTLTDPQKLSAPTRQALVDLDIEHVLIPGGKVAVSDSVRQEIEQLGITVRRFEGQTRTDTARLVSEYALTSLDFSTTHVNLALGMRFPDALAGGPHAGKERSPILLTADVDTLGAAARRYLEEHSSTLQDGHIFGGTSAVSAAVQREAELAAQGSATSSPSPTGTASPAPTASGTASPSPSATASPTTAPFSCSDGSASPAPTASPTASPSPTASVSPSPSPSPTASSGDPAAVTTRPELVGVALAGEPTLNDNNTTDFRDDFCQVQVRFTFDEPVIGRTPIADRFVLVGFNPATRFNGRSALIESNGVDVLVTFGRSDNLATPANEREDVGSRQLAEVSLAVVDQDAVVDNSGSGNPIGDLPLGITRSVPAFPAGITAAPDLVDFVIESSTTTSASVRYVFDETVASIVKSTGFHVVTEGNSDVTCTSPMMSGTSVSALCALPLGDPVARGYVESRTVSDEPAPNGADGNLNPLHAERVSDLSRTSGPDLVAAEFRPVADGDDTVLFTFDEDVFVGDATRFVVYQADTDEFRSVRAVRQADPRQVLASFEPDDHDGDLGLITADIPALSNAVGVSVLEGAVIQAGGVNRPNQEDELAVLNDLRSTLAAGRTIGPDLIGVSINTEFGTATYTFDEALANSNPTVSKLLLYNSDGTRLTCRTGIVNPPAGTVTCTEYTSGLLSVRASPNNAVLGTADDAAVRDGDGNPNPEGGHITTGGNGTPRS